MNKDLVKPVMIDVGANEGDDSLYFNGIVYAIEPHKECFNTLVSRSKKLEDYHVYNLAIDSVPGKRKFNLGCVSGVSSLNELSGAEEWKKIEFANFNGSTEVDCVRLDHFIDDNNISSIDYIHIDTQGHDLIVMQSLGDKLDIVKNGVLECAWNKETKLYQNSPTLEDCIGWLIERDFVISGLDRNDPHGLEVNVFFCHKKFLSDLVFKKPTKIKKKSWYI